MEERTRDLLVVARESTTNPKGLEKEIYVLTKTLYLAENMTNFCSTNEIIDFNKRKIITKPRVIVKWLKKENKNPFVFLYNKN